MKLEGQEPLEKEYEWSPNIKVHTIDEGCILFNRLSTGSPFRIEKNDITTTVFAKFRTKKTEIYNSRINYIEFY